jgi:hypothetical protein
LLLGKGMYLMRLDDAYNKMTYLGCNEGDVGGNVAVC